MSPNWADNIAEQLISRKLFQKGTCLILGGADTGKTALAAALTNHLTANGPVGFIDADIGQSHIGPPSTVGWTIVNKSHQVSFSHLTVGGISFVGDITPTGHLLQLTAAIAQCVQQVSGVTEVTIIDTPGFISGPAACALWWSVQQAIQPELILAVQRTDELSDILTGLRYLNFGVEVIECPPKIPVKSPQRRRKYRQSQFGRYFQDSRLYNISLNDVVVQARRFLRSELLIDRLVALRDGKGTDRAVGVITKWQKDNNVVVVRAPNLYIQQISCIVIGDVSIKITDG
ncbi:MAG: Clp1/GlmU family protein [Planctomycetota bacterium]|jgi:polynucleotide 5'-hydroxyl-kinase GRC3/NOL9